LLERDIQKQCIDYLLLKNILITRHTPTRLFNNKGIVAHARVPKWELGVGDIICCVKGKYVELEIKNEKGVLSDYQKIRRNHVIDAYGYYFVIRSPDDLIKALEEVV